MSSDDYKKKKKKKYDRTLEDIALGRAPELQPKKIDGQWRYPLHMPIPDKHMTCPKCDNPNVKDTGAKTVENHTIFRCDDCHIEFVQVKKAKIAWCEKHQKKIVGKMCLGCHVFKQNIRQWLQDYGPNARCPYFKEIDNVEDDFHANKGT